MTMIMNIFEIIGTIAFAISGSIVAANKKMDVFGILILGLITAVGGGAIRDDIIGNIPPATFQDPFYAIIALSSSFVLFIIYRLHISNPSPRFTELTLFIFDSIGLASFTVTGLQITQQLYPHPGITLLLFVGPITGIGGGILRDLFAGDIPFIFQKHVYATASILGTIFYIILYFIAPHWIAAITSCLLIIITRTVSYKFKLNLPGIGTQSKSI